MIIKLFEETISDTEEYLTSAGLVKSLNKKNNLECCNEVVDRCKKRFGDNLVPPEVVEVQACKVTNKDYNILESVYYVVKYNNKYYDYCADEYFSDYVQVTVLPVVQPALEIANEDKLVALIHPNTSTVKDYVLVRILDAAPEEEEHEEEPDEDNLSNIDTEDSSDDIDLDNIDWSEVFNTEL